MDRPRVMVVIPAYREAATIGQVVASIAPYLPVLVVDDGSPDDTGAVADAAGAQVVRNDPNLGYDGALNRGFEVAAAAGAEAVITMDADGEHGPEHVEAFRALLQDEGVPLVLGVRPRRQRLAEVIMGGYIRWRYGIDDILCGMKGYHMALWRQNGGFDHIGGVGTELALRSVRRGVTFRQIRISGRPRADSPRFDGALRANLRIVRALLLALASGAGMRSRR